MTNFLTFYEAIVFGTLLEYVLWTPNQTFQNRIWRIPVHPIGFSKFRAMICEWDQFSYPKNPRRNSCIKIIKGYYTSKLYPSNKKHTKTSLRVIFRTLEPKITQTFCLESKRPCFFRGGCPVPSKMSSGNPWKSARLQGEETLRRIGRDQHGMSGCRKRNWDFLNFFFGGSPGGYPGSLSWNFICVAGICIYIFRWQYQITLLFNSYWPMLRLDSRVRSDWIFFCSSGTNSEGSSGGCAATSQGPQTITQPARHFLVSSWRKTGWWKKTTLLS